MKLKPIKTKRDYQAALKLAETLWDAPMPRKAARKRTVSTC
jgi:hypothetical protein